jgi:hypothetical protein
MKKIFICTMMMAMAATSFCQETNSTQPHTKQDYLKKSKDQKTAAWVLLGGGTVMIGTGFLIGARKESSFDDAATGFIIAVVGVVSDIGSIPLFIASGRNKRKAIRISFRNETAPQLLKNSFAYRSVPSVTLKISL